MSEKEVFIDGINVGTADTTIKPIIQNNLMKVYSTINDYFENIMNAPSTINRILPYYGYAVNVDDPTKRYIVFNGEIIREYTLSFPKKRYDWVIDMSEIQYCKNCKHLEHDGMFGIFCGVNGNNINYDCPKYEKEE